MLKSIVAVSAGLIGGAHAFWRMECPGRVGVARIDPIVDPGTISKHAHSIHGSSGKPKIFSINAGLGIFDLARHYYGLAWHRGYHSPCDLCLKQN